MISFVSVETPAGRFQKLFWELVPQCRLCSEARTVDWIEKQLSALGKGAEDRFARYIFASGLLAYGRLDMVDEILDAAPAAMQWGSGKVVFLGSNAIRALLPIPELLRGAASWYSHVDVIGVRKWLHQNRDALRWDAGRFVL